MGLDESVFYRIKGSIQGHPFCHSLDVSVSISTANFSQFKGGWSWQRMLLRLQRADQKSYKDQTASGKLKCFQSAAFDKNKFKEGFINIT